MDLDVALVEQRTHRLCGLVHDRVQTHRFAQHAQRVRSIRQRQLEQVVEQIRDTVGRAPRFLEKAALGRIDLSRLLLEQHLQVATAMDYCDPMRGQVHFTSRSGMS